MMEERPESEELSFGEQLMGMQGFSAARARRYRAELEKLLVRRMTRPERWSIGLMGIYLFATFELIAVVCARKSGQPDFPIPSNIAWAFAAAFAVLGLLVGGWFLRIALQGGFSRRLGDVMGVAITLIFGGAAACLFYILAWTIQDQIPREQMQLGGGIALGSTVGCAVLAAIQYMHRQTQEKLLRIEYHLAELMERDPRSTPS